MSFHPHDEEPDMNVNGAGVVLCHACGSTTDDFGCARCESIGTPAQQRQIDRANLSPRHSAGPWEWRSNGDDYYLATAYSGRKVVLDSVGLGGRRSTLRVRTTSGPSLMIAFDALHPDARLIKDAPTLKDALADQLRLVAEIQQLLEQSGRRLNDDQLLRISNAQELLARHGDING